MASVLDAVTIAIALIVIAVFIIAFLELRYLRKKIRARRVRAARKVEELPDDAHNAIITTKAIMATMERSGVRSEEAVSLMAEAQMAYDRRNYRVVLDMASQVKEKLMVIKARQAAAGDLAKLESMPARGDSEETTTKELLQKEYPPNYLPAKFSLELAHSSIDQSRAAGRDVSQAEQLLVDAQARFGAKDYAGALASARLAQRSAAGEPVEAASPGMPKPLAVDATLVCTSCGAALQSDDVFCRKCGARVGPEVCASCGTTLVAGDAFCRKCGTAIPT